MAKNQGSTVDGLVLKRVSVGEADRIVTLLTPQRGKVVAIAKSSRKLSSSQRSALEPGSQIRAYLVETHSMPILTQAMLRTDAQFAHQSLTHIKKLLQLLEIYDRLFVEDETDAELYLLAIRLVTMLKHSEIPTSAIKNGLNELVVGLGFPALEETDHKSITEYVAELAEHKMKSFDYLSVK